MRNPVLVHLLVLLGVAGCGDDDADLRAACGGARPTLAECTRRGMFFAECGGSAGARFACSEGSGECLWFADGCVAAGFRASDCPADDLCCESSADGRWPFTDDWVASVGPSQIADDVAAFGDAAVTRVAPATIEVVVDESLGAPPTAGFSCTTSGSLEVCNGSPAVSGLGLGHAGDTLMMTIRVRAVNAEVVYVEVVPQATGAIARAFVRRVRDSIPPEHPVACNDVEPIVLGGRIVVSSLTERDAFLIHHRLELDLPDGGVLTAAF